jgi:S1-C subfamily serine protease
MKPEVEERVKQATLLVFTKVSKDSKGDTPIGSGSGFFINSTGLLMTNNHVVDPTHMKSEAEKQNFHYRQGTLTFSVVANSGTEDEKVYEAKMVYQNESADQALLQAVDEEGEMLETPHYLRLMPDSRLDERLRVFAMGFPGGDRQRTQKDKHPEVTITKGSVIADGIPFTPAGRIRMIYTDVNVRPGNSGGPSVDIDGYLIGTNTLMTKPEFRSSGAGANYAALVPAKLTGEMVRNAFILDKFPDGSDVTPFMGVLTTEKGTVNIPEYSRHQERDVLYYEDGDRTHGKISTETITWNCALGEIEVPVSAIAYVMSNDEGSHLFIEGGNRIGSDEMDSTFTFAPVSGDETEMSFEDVKTVAFHSGDREIAPVLGEVIVFDSDLTHLRLKEVKGKVTFSGKSEIAVGLKDIARIELNEYDEHVLTLRDGQRMTGAFGEQKFEAVIASTGTPISFGLTEISKALVERHYFSKNTVAGLPLKGVLARASKDVRNLVMRLEEEDDAQGVVEATDVMIADKSSFRARQKTQQDQVRLLNGVAKLRLGKYREAEKALGKAKRSDNENVAVFAKAALEVLKRYDNYEYKGKPLTDKPTLIAAGKAMARETIRDVRIRIKNGRSLEFDNPGDYFTVINDARKAEPNLKVAAVFLGEEADDELLRIWRHAQDACRKEFDRIQRERQEKGGGKGSSNRRGSARRGGARRSSGSANQRELDKLAEAEEKVLENWRKYFVSLMDYGFRIEDPDIQHRRERLADQRGWDDDEEEDMEDDESDDD